MEEYATQDYGLANWLAFNRVTLLGTVKYPNSTRKSFVFVWEERIPDLEQAWGKPFDTPETEPALTCKKFFQAHSLIKQALKESYDIS